MTFPCKCTNQHLGQRGKVSHRQSRERSLCPDGWPEVHWYSCPQCCRNSGPHRSERGALRAFVELEGFGAMEVEL